MGFPHYSYFPSPPAQTTGHPKVTAVYSWKKTYATDDQEAQCATECAGYIRQAGEQGTGIGLLIAVSPVNHAEK
jgi:hypothetical protein